MQSRLKLLVFILLVLAVSISTVYSAPVPLVPASPVLDPPACSHQALIAIDPPATASLTIQPNSIVTVKVNITNSCPITAFVVSIVFNVDVLKFDSFVVPVGQPDGSYAGSVLGAAAQPEHICHDGQFIAGSSGRCQPYDTGGVVSVGLYLLSATPTPDPTSGLLFQVNLKVVKPGFSQFHIFQEILNNGATGIPPPHTRSDGYFSNSDCPIGSGRLCTAPVVNLVLTASPLFLGAAGNFSSQGTRSSNQFGFVQTMIWDWGDGNSDSQNATFIRHVFGKSPGNFSVTLTVTDNYGTTASKTISVVVKQNWLELSLDDVKITPQASVYPGALIKIRVFVENNSSIAQNATLTISLEGKILNAGNFSLRAFRNTNFLDASWDSTGAEPRMYRIESVATSPAPQTPKFHLNSTAHSRLISYVQLIEPLPTSFGVGLSLTQVSALSIIGVAGLVFLAARLKKKPAWMTEPL